MGIYQPESWTAKW